MIEWNSDSENARTNLKSLSLLGFVSLLLCMSDLFTVTVSMDSLRVPHCAPSNSVRLLP